MMYFPKEGIMPVSPYTSPIITLFIVVILGARLNRNIQKIEQFNDELAFEVKKVSDELFSSLSDKHQLELSNVRLQERIKLSHDLHDGLGASIVRSMILVDQCEKDIPNTQFLSMLKLLRDDLRQIIDSGSSLDSKVPDSPLLWIAPVRHRFSQLMEEMEIISKWNFPAAWKERPSSLQCLTLIRVVEESLTNIVKHSKATTVKVTMTHKENEPLILIIEDDGIGFDVESVSTHGMSVGMRSMKMRIQRIGGKLNIISQAGSTIIQAEIQIKSAA
ncbi:sensor histidine kinase [Acinetobacter gandensis]|uniref:sensor histidine kinase n=2 Tax=Moraxellaceae TaxID=468 RepID=UPI003988FAAB